MSVQVVPTNSVKDLAVTSAKLASSLSIGQLAVTGTSQLTGTVGIGTAPLPNYGLNLGIALSGASTQYGAVIIPVASSAATATIYGVFSRISTAAAVFTATNGVDFLADAPNLGSGSAITNQTGLLVVNQGAAGITNAYGIFINTQSGASGNNFALCIGSVNERIYNPKNAPAHLEVHSNDGYLMLMSASGMHAGQNVWWDGTNWQLINSGTVSWLYAIVPSGHIWYQAPAGGVGFAALATLAGVSGTATFAVAGSVQARRIAAFYAGGSDVTYTAGDLACQRSSAGDGAIYFGTANTWIYYTGTGGNFTFTGGPLNVTTGGNNAFAGTISCTSITVNGALLAAAAAGGQQALIANSGNGDLILGGATSRIYFHPNLTVGILQGYPNASFFGWTGLLCNGVTTNSSRRWKTEITTIHDALGLVMDPSLEGTHFLFNPPLAVERDVPKYGLIAEAWHARAPDVVRLDEDGEPSSMDYGQVTAILFQAFKEYVAQTDARILELERRS